MDYNVIVVTTIDYYEQQQLEEGELIVSAICMAAQIDQRKMIIAMRETAVYYYILVQLQSMICIMRATPLLSSYCTVLMAAVQSAIQYSTYNLQCPGHIKSFSLKGPLLYNSFSRNATQFSNVNKQLTYHGQQLTASAISHLKVLGECIIFRKVHLKKMIMATYTICTCKQYRAYSKKIEGC